MRHHRTTNIKEGNLEFVFDDQCTAIKHDGFPFYRKHFQSMACGSNGDTKYKKLAHETLARHRWRIVLHIEKSEKHLSTTLSDIQIKMKRIVGAVDSEPIVMNAKSNFKQKPWRAIVRQLLAAIHGNFATVSLFEVGRV